MPFTDRFLVTGVNGQLGVEVMRCCAEKNITATGFSRSELDITNIEALEKAVKAVGATCIINCAAYTNVDKAEDDVEAAFSVNEQGSRVLARVCKNLDIHLVSVSTDYVFPGTNPEGYAENDQTGPINVYGESKLAGEKAIIEELEGKGCIARTAWLFSAQEPNFVLTIAKAAKTRDFLEVVNDQKGNPTWAGHLAAALVECAKNRLSGVHHLVDQPEATWFDLAKEVVAQTGADCEVRATSSEKFVRKAKRAEVSVLKVTRSDTPKMGNWRDGVRASVKTPFGVA